MLVFGSSRGSSPRGSARMPAARGSGSGGGGGFPGAGGVGVGDGGGVIASARPGTGAVGAGGGSGGGGGNASARLGAGAARAGIFSTPAAGGGMAEDPVLLGARGAVPTGDAAQRAAAATAGGGGGGGGGGMVVEPPAFGSPRGSARMLAARGSGSGGGGGGGSVFLPMLVFPRTGAGGSGSGSSRGGSTAAASASADKPVVLYVPPQLSSRTGGSGARGVFAVRDAGAGAGGTGARGIHAVQPLECAHPPLVSKVTLFFLLNTHLKSIYSIPPKVAGGVLQLYSLKKSLLSSLVRVPVVAGTFP